MNKLYEEASVMDIANALRLKRDGSSETYKISQMDDGVLSLPMGNIPSYHYAEAGRVVAKLLELKEEHKNSIIFGTISDNHVDKSTVNTMTSARHAAFALETVGGMTCDFIANLGDNNGGESPNGNNIDNDVGYANAVYMENASRYALIEFPSFNLVGNHCKSNSTQKIYDLIGKYNVFDVYSTTKIRGFGYKDYTDKKVRVIVLNTCDYWNAQGGNGMSYEQKDFLMKSLDLSSKSDYSSWTIIILSHIPLDYLGGDYSKGADLKAILKAYNDGTDVSISVNSSYASAQNESSSYSGTLTYNYAGKNAPKVINIHGHVHNNCYGKLTFIDDNTVLDMVRVATPNSSFNGNCSTDRYTSAGNYSITTEEADKILKVANSKADTSATFYCIDLDKQTIYAVGYGADIDRTIIYKNVKTYKVTLNLTHASASNTATEVVEDEIYNNILTANSGYTLNTVKVTMGGVDITASAYEDGVIKIGNSTDSGAIITGDIVITAVAAAPLVTETITPHIAPRSTWYDGLSGGALTLVQSNFEGALGVSTPNSYAFTDRNSKTFYLMPIKQEYCKAKLNYSATDGLDVRYFLQVIKDNGGTFTSVVTVGKGADTTITWTAGENLYLLASIEHTDGTSKWDWNSTGKTITVTFSNQ